MSENDQKKEIIKRPGDQLVRSTKAGSSLASRGLALLNQGKAKGIENAPPSPSPVHKVGDTKTILLPGGVEMVFCYIPAGEFMMGSPEDEIVRDFNEKLHRVILSEPFWLGKYQVTQGQWEAVMRTNPSFFTGCSRCPVENVTWNDCQGFIKRLNLGNDGNVYALPTEEQWEYACRAGTTTPFCFGETITPDEVNYNGNFPYGDSSKGLFREKTIPVGSLNRPNSWGLHDMHGNVWEWCEDWFKEYSLQRITGNDSKGSRWGEKVLRGGSCGDRADLCRSAVRLSYSPNERLNGIGVRLVIRASKNTV